MRCFGGAHAKRPCSFERGLVVFAQDYGQSMDSVYAPSLPSTLSTMIS